MWLELNTNFPVERHQSIPYGNYVKVLKTAIEK